MFPDLNITGYGFFYIKFQFTSFPAEYSFTLNEKIEILSPSHVGMVIEESYEMQVNIFIIKPTLLFPEVHVMYYSESIVIGTPDGSNTMARSNTLGGPGDSPI